MVYVSLYYFLHIWPSVILLVWFCFADFWRPLVGSLVFCKQLEFPVKGFKRWKTKCYLSACDDRIGGFYLLRLVNVVATEMAKMHVEFGVKIMYCYL